MPRTMMITHCNAIAVAPAGASVMRFRHSSWWLPCGCGFRPAALNGPCGPGGRGERRAYFEYCAARSSARRSDSCPSNSLRVRAVDAGVPAFSGVVKTAIRCEDSGLAPAFATQLAERLAVPSATVNSVISTFTPSAPSGLSRRGARTMPGGKRLARSLERA